MTYPTYGGQENYGGGYDPGPPSGGLPAQGYPSGPFPTQTYGAPPPLPPKPRRGNTMVALVVALVVLVGLAGTFTTLWLIESGNHRQTSSDLQNKEKELADSNSARKATQDKLDESNRKLTDAQKTADDA